MLIYINEQLYKVRRVKALTRHGRAWSLQKPDGRTYLVSHYDRVASCSCPDHQKRGSTCKHIQALRAAGLLPRRVVRKGVARV